LFGAWRRSTRQPRRHPGTDRSHHDGRARADDRGEDGSEEGSGSSADPVRSILEDLAGPAGRFEHRADRLDHLAGWLQGALGSSDHLAGRLQGPLDCPEHLPETGRRCACLCHWT
jgi:hypothetical protein